MAGRKGFTRHGASLAETLVAIMILSIGILGIAALFPISIQRGLQATHLTNATILRYNVETQIEITPSLVSDPDLGTPVKNTSYLVDPLGFVRSGNSRTFGNIPRYPGLTRFDSALPMTSGAEAESRALEYVTLPDSWVNIVEGEFDSFTSPTYNKTTETGRIELPADASLGDVEYESPFVSRVVLFDSDLRASHSRQITNITGRNIEWSNDIDGNGTEELSDNGEVPVGFQAGSFRIQTRESRYTWLLSVRNGSFSANVDVVVFFRREFSEEDETVHEATFVSDSREVGVAVAANSEPPIKKGGFVFESVHAHWYRVQDVAALDSSDPRFPAYTHILTIDRPANDDSGEDADLDGVLDMGEDSNGDNDLTFGEAMFMQGVVEVFPIGVTRGP